MHPKQEDLQVLGLELPISRAAITTAYRRLIVANHPDLGGDDYKMARINSARDRLLACVEQPPAPLLSHTSRGASSPHEEDADDPPPYIYFVWMVLLPVVAVTLLYVTLSLIA